MKGLLLLLTTISYFFSQAQAENGLIYPEIGKPCPDFVLRNVNYYTKRQIALSDFKEKWLVLDFWNKSCGACIASFPKTSAMQKEFDGKVQFILVGIEDKEKQIEPMYSKFKKKEGLIIPCAFDSLLANRWDIYTSPYIVVIAPGGIVQAITYSISPEDMCGFLAGKNPRLPRAYRMHEEEVETHVFYDKKKPFLVNGNGGTDTSFLFRTIFSKFDVYTQHYSLPQKISAIDTINGRFQVLGASLSRLYNYAYYGMIKPDSGYNEDPILEVRDSTPFHFSSKYNENLFCYSLILPPAKASKRHMQQMMQKDLENYFNYTVNIEERKFSCWRIVATEEGRQRLKTKGGPELFQPILPKADFIAQNWPVAEFLHLLRIYIGKDIEDETGIIGNIDIHMSCILTDLEDIKKALRSNGLDLISGEKLKKVLVIRDRP